MSNKKVFSEKNYKTNDGMQTSIWGPPMWHILHTISFNYPVKPTKEDQENYYNFFFNIQYVLPCKSCRDNLSIYLKKHPINSKILKNRESLSKYIYKLHENVNKKLDKNSGLSFEDIKDRFEHFRARCIINPVQELKSNNCTEALYGIKSKCVLNIIPKDNRKKSLIIDPNCYVKKEIS